MITLPELMQKIAEIEQRVEVLKNHVDVQPEKKETFRAASPDPLR